jgi:hypothetical protein
MNSSLADLDTVSTRPRPRRDTGANGITARIHSPTYPGSSPSAVDQPADPLEEQVAAHVAESPGRVPRSRRSTPPISSSFWTASDFFFGWRGRGVRALGAGDRWDADPDHGLAGAADEPHDAGHRRHPRSRPIRASYGRPTAPDLCIAPCAQAQQSPSTGDPGVVATARLAASAAGRRILVGTSDAAARRAVSESRPRLRPQYARSTPNETGSARRAPRPSRRTRGAGAGRHDRGVDIP